MYLSMRRVRESASGANETWNTNDSVVVNTGKGIFVLTFATTKRFWKQFAIEFVI